MGHGGELIDGRLDQASGEAAVPYDAAQADVAVGALAGIASGCRYIEHRGTRSRWNVTDGEVAAAVRGRSCERAGASAIAWVSGGIERDRGAA